MSHARVVTTAACALALLLVTAAPCGGAVRPGVDAASRRHALELALERWDVPKAAWDAAALLAEHGETEENLVAAARVAFFEADYPRALDFARRAAALGRPDGEGRGFVAYLEERSGTWGSFEEHASEHFVLRVTPRDALLVPWALDTLERAAAALGADLGACPERPIVVEIYPSRRAFIAASTLTREEVETSGTVAICHFNRIMILSPAVAARGYDWLDTLCHELVHHFVYRLGGDGVPVWLHEGIAKVLESRWRGPLEQRPDARMASLLAEARERGTWIPFSDMHPSIAKLPSGALVSLAFAQVSATVRLLIEEGGVARISELVHELSRRSGDLEGALVAVTGSGLTDLEARARRHVESMPLERIKGLALLAEDAHDPTAFRFQDEGAAAPEAEAETAALSDRRARDFTTLGDRLKGRLFHEAAIVEYDKALAILGHSEPLVVNRKAHAMISVGQLAEARRLLEGILRDYPDFTPTLDNLAHVHAELARADAAAGNSRASASHVTEALALARASERINPFNPDTQVRLLALLSGRGSEAEIDLARERLTRLQELTR